MDKRITPEVLRTVVENVNGADAITDYMRAEYDEIVWCEWGLRGKRRPAVIMQYPEDSLRNADAYTGVMVARVLAEVARTVVAADDGETKFDAEDVLEDLYVEMTQVRTTPDSRGLAVVFTATEPEQRL